MKLRGNAFIRLPRGTQVLLENDDGSATWIVLEESVKVCSNSQAEYRELELPEVDA